MADGGEKIADSFDFDSWVKKYEFTEKTVTILRKKELTSLQVLRVLTLADVKELRLTMGQRKTLQMALEKLNNDNWPISNVMKPAASETCCKQHPDAGLQHCQLESRRRNLKQAQHGEIDTTQVEEDNDKDSLPDIREGNSRGFIQNSGIESSFDQITCQANINRSNVKQLRSLIKQDSETITNSFRHDGKLAEVRSVTRDTGQNTDNTNSMEVEYSTSIVKKSSALKPTFRNPIVLESKEQAFNVEDILRILDIEKYHPSKISLQQIMSILVEPIKSYGPIQVCPLAYLSHLLMLDFRTRDFLLPQQTGEQTNISNQIQSIFNTNNLSVGRFHPQDLFLLFFQCCDLPLRQVLMAKCFLCRLAIPFISPVNDKLECAIWSLRNIVINYKTEKNKTIENSVLTTELDIIGFCRVHDIPNLSKSKLLNELLSESAHPTFYHRDCLGGKTQRLVSNGIIEASWYLPSGIYSDVFKRCTMFLNLRGDCLEHERQVSIINKIASITVLFVNVEELAELKICNAIKGFMRNTLTILVISYQDKMEMNNQFAIDLRQENERPLSIIYTFTDGMKKDASQIRKEVQSSIDNYLTHNVNRNTLEACIKGFREEHCIIDEDNTFCEEGRQCADKLFRYICKTPTNIESDILPMQEDPRNRSKKPQKAVKEERKCTAREDTDILQIIMVNAIGDQLESCKTSHDRLDTFTQIIGNLSTTHLLPFSLCWIKLYFDRHSRDNLPSLRRAFYDNWREFQEAKRTNDVLNLNNKRETMHLAEKSIFDASFGLEHLIRNLGQTYEAGFEKKSQDIVRNRLDDLSVTVAHMLIGGQPFELMDGDAGNIPIKWVKAIFTSLENILGQSRVFIVTVLGIQSSGKSTLLNTMFGVQFSVSAGRCTRGIYMQMLRVDKKNSDLQFDYVLVLDTEGLRAPEYEPQNYYYDNKMATLAIGLGDVTMVNIKGENYAELKDVFQSAVHAFLRLKHVTEINTSRRRWIFIHQNVPAINAEAKLRHGCQKLLECLDDMAPDAALLEDSPCSIRRFSDIIDFDCFSDVWFLPGLWNGDPPMAHPNIGYIEKVKLLKNEIIQVSKRRKSFLRLCDFFQTIEGLWEGIQCDDIFNYQNFRVHKAYNNSDNMVINIQRNLEQDVNPFMKTRTETLTSSRGSHEEARQCGINLNAELRNIIDTQSRKRTKLLAAYFDSSPYADYIAQYHGQKIQTLKLYTLDLLADKKCALKVCQYALTFCNLLKWKECQQNRSTQNEAPVEFRVRIWEGIIDQLMSSFPEHVKIALNQLDQCRIHSRSYTGNLQFDNVLVLDTEGLRAPEYEPQNYNHDNKMATLAIGLGDVTMVNIKGENYAELKDVFQSAVHAFPRLKHVTEINISRRRWIFVHQNVPAINAEAKLRHGCQKLLACLDDMAPDATILEDSPCSIRRFSDIIDFDCSSDVWFLPGLWNGDPPMAHPNIGYIENDKLLKNEIIQVSKRRKSFLRLCDFFQTIEGLWEGIQSDNIFDYQNFRVHKAYNNSDNMVINIQRNLEQDVNPFMKTRTETLMSSCGSHEEARQCGINLNAELRNIIDTQSRKRTKLLAAYFDSSPYADYIAQYHGQKIQALKLYTLDWLAYKKFALKVCQYALTFCNWLKWKECQQNLSTQNEAPVEFRVRIWEGISDQLMSSFLVLNQLDQCRIHSRSYTGKLEVSIEIYVISKEEGHFTVTTAQKQKKKLAKEKLEKFSTCILSKHFNQNLRNADIYLQDLQMTDNFLTPNITDDHIMELIAKATKHQTPLCRSEASNYEIKIFPPWKIKIALKVCPYKRNLGQECAQLENIYKSLTTETVKWEEKIVYVPILEKLWGCGTVCHFCLEPCLCSECQHNDRMPQKCIQQRPGGIVGRFSKDNDKLVITACNKCVLTENSECTEKSPNDPQLI